MMLSRALRDQQKLIDRALRKALRSGQAPDRLRHAMGYSLLAGGKRYRPLLCLAAAEATGARPETALTAACALEMIHTYSLVHDDLPAMDNADRRRGQPSCHKRFDEATAILVGDALLTRAFELLSGNGLPNALAVIRELATASGTRGLVGGQALDLQPRRQSPAELESIARRKTAALITASVVAGGLAGNAPPRRLTALRQFGQRLGLAFQLMDDAHDGDGLASAVGREVTRRKALRLIEQATRRLAPFGDRAARLRKLADWLAST